jgi:hypothetical protein
MRHVGVVVQVRVVLSFFLDDAEDTRRCLSSFLAARHRSLQYRAVGVVDGDALVAQRDDRHDWLVLGPLDGHYRPFGWTACGIRDIAHRDDSGSVRNEERKPNPSPLALQPDETSCHVPAPAAG